MARKGREVRVADIKAAALRLFSLKGFAGSSMEDIAAGAGVAKATVYLYFQSKEALLHTCVMEALKPSDTVIRRIVLNQNGSTANKLRRVLDIWDNYLDAPDAGMVFRLVLAEAQNFPILARYYHLNILRRITMAIREIISHGVEGGEFRCVDVDATVEIILAPYFLSAIMPQSEWHGQDVRRNAMSLIDVLFEGLSGSQSRLSGGTIK